ncbi:hypothetical protein D3C72_1844070 [compost metagenome]
MKADGNVVLAVAIVRPWAIVIFARPASLDELSFKLGGERIAAHVEVLEPSIAGCFLDRVAPNLRIFQRVESPDELFASDAHAAALHWRSSWFSQ